MIILEDIVFQNDRYYLLFSDEAAKSLADTDAVKYVIGEDGCIARLHHCETSSVLKIANKIVLETKENLSAVESRIRKNEQLKIASNL